MALDKAVLSSLTRRFKPSNYLRCTPWSHRSPPKGDAAVLPVAAYAGGKRNLAARLCALIETIPHATYAEPFVGMGGVFLRRRVRARAEVIDDISADVVTLFRVLQEHYPYFIDLLKWRLTSRAEFAR